MLAEREPENLPPPNEVEVAHAYHELMEGYVTQDLASIKAGSYVISRSDVPFSKSVATDAWRFEHTLMGGEDTEHEAEDAFATLLRSYVYSDLSLDATFTVMCVQLLGKDRKWLKEILKPDHGTEYELRRYYDIDYDMSRLRHKHASRELKKAMHTMGMPTRLGGFILKLFN